MSDAAAAHGFRWGGHRLELLAERAVRDPLQDLLLLADLHLGKAETFQAHGIPLPSDGDATDLGRLIALAQRWRPRQVIVLGDLIHGRLGLTPRLRQALRELPQQLGCPLRLIGGNHERGSWLEGLPQEPSLALGPLWLSHAPEPRPGLLNVCGHVHPVACVGGGADRLRLPCFAFRRAEDCLVLPAFGHLTGGHPCSEGEDLWLVADDAIVPWTPDRRRRRRQAA
ncbi:MAG: ligase-associated DNA damage response endonuclease PdeM [Synechococcaceae cyanobacterium]|nr:ligase-associated DNA damage response endonuclease PdeM [Synechococcaceae cyanobacterium]